jgi:hypothetical protein
MTNEKVGRAAGAVWSILRKRGTEGCTLYEIKKSIETFSTDEVVAGVGWLAREDKIVWRQDGRKSVLALRESELAVRRELAGAAAASN